MNLAEKVTSLPLSPGVYLMKDSLGHIIYVGKAKSLKKRVQSYFHNAKSHSPKVKRLVQHIRDLEVILTDTEFEAFLLECSLIKQIKPMYNKKMKNPLAYTYIIIRTTHPWRQIELTYDPGEPGGNLCFGPYTSRGTVERAVLGLKESLHILCSSPHIRNSPCLNHSLGLCLGMCTGTADAVKRYEDIIDRIIALLNGTDTGILKEMEQRMAGAAERFDFETAAKTRDSIAAVSFLLHKEKITRFAQENQNLAVFEPMDGHHSKLMLIKGHRMIGAARIATGHHGTEQLRSVVQSAIMEHFKLPSANPSLPLSRDDIDEAQIIYSHLQGNSCRYISIPGEWLAEGNTPALNAAVAELIES
ncbi:GIY-YIG nuclease family protein [Paenibacillus albidus]|uniref:GIY-YIG nuclease family protein n=1 Tax=Paenibacillus albidus TaxID=2041023 RepID=UPI001BE918EC|nr:GIY-YIG nuclease family protein [Paenibacillus albidus]MBT2291425.1 GIY-YIG nuclease family protein [Paenibacillus albidus]